MKIAIGADHAGFELKEKLKSYLQEEGHEVVDVGARAYERSDDYPDFAQKAADMVSEGKVDRGILLCDSGIGVDVVANKVPGVRSALVHDENLARLTRLHNDTNVLSLGAMFVNEEQARHIADTWLHTEFSGEERHKRRVAKITEIERRETATIHEEEIVDTGED